MPDKEDGEYYLNAKMCQSLIEKLETDKLCLIALIHDNSSDDVEGKTEVLELLCEYFVTIKNFLDFLSLIVTTQPQVNSGESGNEYLVTEAHKQTIDLYRGTIILLEMSIQERCGIVLTRQ